MFRRPRRLRVATLLTALAWWVLAPAPAAAATSVSLYSYDLAGSGGSVPNRAAHNGSVALRLHGDWARDGNGVSFRGNTSGQRSVGTAKPASGPTLDVAASSAVGAAAVFRWTPPAGGACPSDSKNLLQIGRFAKGQTQIKLQMSRCRNGVVKPQCRVAGAASPAGVAPVTGAGSISPGRWYRLECVKSPDGGAGVTVRLTDLGTGTTKTADATIPKTGPLVSSKELSVANKYPMPAPAQNSDQFVGVVRRVGICAGGSVSAVRTCLASAAG